MVTTQATQPKINTLRSAHTMGLVPATGPGDQAPSCELPILVKDVVTGTKLV